MNNYYNPVSQTKKNIKNIYDIKQSVSLMKETVTKIKNSVGTKKIEYPEYKESYDYVDNLFPSVKIKKVVIFQVSPSYLAKLGYAGVGGFFEKINKSVVISSRDSLISSSSFKKIKGKMTKDEVIVHELIHYCYDIEGYLVSSSHLKEEFAYGWSLGYLRKKGYSDDQIIKFNYLPYLYLVCGDEATLKTFYSEGINVKKYSSLSNIKKNKILLKLQRKIHEKCLELSYSMGEKIISIYSNKLNNENGIEKKERKNRNYFLDLEEDN